MKRRGRETAQFIIDDEVFVEAPDVAGGFNSADAVGFMLAPDAPQAEAVGIFRFGRMFRRPNLPPYRSGRDGLIELGRDMGERADPGSNSSLAAGYDYLGQFIDHNLSFNAKTDRLPARSRGGPRTIRTPEKFATVNSSLGLPSASSNYFIIQLVNLPELSWRF